MLTQFFIKSVEFSNFQLTESAFFVDKSCFTWTGITKISNQPIIFDQPVLYTGGCLKVPQIISSQVCCCDNFNFLLTHLNGLL